MEYNYSDSFTKPSVRIGTITVIASMIAAFFPNLYLWLAYGVLPDFGKFLAAWLTIIAANGAFYVVEPISYYPIFGTAGTYIGILTGNISQIRMPSAMIAQEVMGVEPSSQKGEVAGILAICGSVVTNTLMLTVAVVAGTALWSLLPSGVQSALSTLVLPSLFGASFAMMAWGHFRIGAVSLVAGLALRLVGVPGWLGTILAVFGIIAINIAMDKLLPKKQ